LSNPVELNRYSYAQENPVNIIDPSGHGDEEEEGGLYAVILGAVRAAGTGIGRLIPGLTEEEIATLLAALGGVLGLWLLLHFLATHTLALPGAGAIPTTSTPSTKEEYVADTGVFADADRLAPGERALLDSLYFDNPNVILDVPDAIYAEVSNTTSPTQLARLAGVPGGAQIVRVPNGSLAGIDVAALQSRNFGVNDMILVQTAKQLGLPVLTANKKPVNQIQSNAPRKAIWGAVVIVVV
jgi:hypothetical protein